MRVLVATTSYPRHGGDFAGAFIARACEAIAKLGHQVTIVAPHAPGLEHQEERAGVRIVRFGYGLPFVGERVAYGDGVLPNLRRDARAWLGLPAFSLAMARALRRLWPGHDVLHAHWAPTGCIARLAQASLASQRRKPYVVTIRGSDMCAIERGGTTARAWLWGLRRAAAICSVARDFVPLLQDRGLPAVYFTPNGYAHTRTAPGREAARRALGLGPEPLVLFVGRINERKGIEYLLAAMGGLNAVLAVVGQGRLLDELRARARDLGAKVLFVGSRPRSEMPSWYAAADVFVLPSFYEGRSNAMIEAIGAGLPCIATNINGNRELVDDGHSGFLVPPGDAPALRERIAALLADPAQRRAFARHGRSLLQREVPSWEQCARRIITVLAGAASPPSPADRDSTPDAARGSGHALH